MPTPFSQLTLAQHFRQLPGVFYRDVMPEPLHQPELVIASSGCAALLDIDAASLNSPEALAILGAQRVPPDWQPLAMKYTGHQFGYYNPDLGDGRGLLLGERQLDNGQLWDLHLKGAGPTPFSRQGDGRAVLRSSIREFLCSEAMHALGIATTRALSVVKTATPVFREQRESGATLLRVAQTHIRFGHFEFAARSSHPDALKTLADYVLARYYPCLRGQANQYADLFLLIAKNTAEMIARWQAVGFNHGVMNTDNMSILGDTFDFGPYGFLDRFNPHHICNHSDDQGRYAFDRQPAIAHWNLAVLAQALSPLVPDDALKAGMQHYAQHFNERYIELMRAKLGLEREQEDDTDLLMQGLSMLDNGKLDYTRFFRELGDWQTDLKQAHALRDHTLDLSAFDAWFARYGARLAQEKTDSSERKKNMDAVNPLYTLRNHLAQLAIQQAEQGDYSEVRRLHAVLQSPFEAQAGAESYAALPPDWASELEVSCSS